MFYTQYHFKTNCLRQSQQCTAIQISSAEFKNLIISHEVQWRRLQTRKKNSWILEITFLILFQPSEHRISNSWVCIFHLWHETARVSLSCQGHQIYNHGWNKAGFRTKMSCHFNAESVFAVIFFTFFTHFWDRFRDKGSREQWHITKDVLLNQYAFVEMKKWSTGLYYSDKKVLRKMWKSVVNSCTLRRALWFNEANYDISELVLYIKGLIYEE